MSNIQNGPGTPFGVTSAALAAQLKRRHTNVMRSIDRARARGILKHRPKVAKMPSRGAAGRPSTVMGYIVDGEDALALLQHMFPETFRNNINKHS